VSGRFLAWAFVWSSPFVDLQFWRKHAFNILTLLGFKYGWINIDLIRNFAQL